MYPEYIMKAVRQYLGVEENDKSKDHEIATMTPFEVFDAYLEWNGVINCSQSIIGAVKDIYGVQL